MPWLTSMHDHAGVQLLRADPVADPEPHVARTYAEATT